MHFDCTQCKQKGAAQFLLILIALIIVLGGLFFYQRIKKNDLLQSPKSIIAEQLNDYSDPVLGLEFKYSKDLIVQADSEESFNKRGNGDFRKNFTGYVGYEPGQFLGAAVVLDQSNSLDTNPLSVWVFNNDNNLTTEQWFQNYWYYPYVWGVFDYTSKGHIALDQEATISGQPARYKIISYQPGKPKFIYAAKDQKMYLIRVIGDAGNNIISSFKFLKSDAAKTNDCKIGGCSSQLCVEGNDRGISTCEWLPKYACYKNAMCERQSNGQCGWTQTDELTKCLRAS